MSQQGCFAHLSRTGKEQYRELLRGVLEHGIDSSGRANLGHALETAVLNDLERRNAEICYVKTEEGFEVDFLARYPTGGQELIQVCADTAALETRARELRALQAAAKEHRHATVRLLVPDRNALVQLREINLNVQPAYEWLLVALEHA